MLELKNVKKKYGEKEAVFINSLEISKNSIFAFIGKNGAGKTTTIKSILGLLNIDSGSIKIDGMDMKTHKQELKRKIGFVADSPMVYDYLTGREFVKFIGLIYGSKDVQQLEERMNQLFQKFEIEDKVDEYINTYSHGTKQKIAIIAAIIHQPELLILDEPTVGLDPQTTKLLKDLLLEEKEKGMTIFLSTHILSIAEEICDHLAIIDHGKIKYQGSLKKLLEYYSSLENAFLELTKEGEK